MSKLNRVTEINISYRHKKDPKDYPPVMNSYQAYGLFLSSWDKAKIDLAEQFRVMLLDSKNGCMGIATIATGGIGSVETDLRLAFATAVIGRASKIIIAHNHPSGNLNHSKADKEITDRFAEAGKVMHVPVVDHLIVTRHGFTSLGDLGLLP